MQESVAESRKEIAYCMSNSISIGVPRSAKAEAESCRLDGLGRDA